MYSRSCTLLTGALVLFGVLYAPLAADEPQPPQRPKNFQPFVFHRSTEQLQQQESAEHVRRAEQAVAKMREVVAAGPYQSTDNSLLKHDTPQWYRDAKFGVMINYGFFAAAGYGATGYHRNRYSDIYPQFMYNREEVQQHHKLHWGEDFERDDFIPLMTASRFDAEAYASLIDQAGARYVVFWANHRTTGMPLWDCSYTFRDSVDMPPHRDLWGELVKACKKRGLRYGPYLNIEVSDYPLIARDGSLVLRQWTSDVPQQPIPETGLRENTLSYEPANHARRIQGLVPVRDYVRHYMLPVAKEMVDRYEPDLLWFDGGWKRLAAYYDTRLLVSYYYNRLEGNSSGC